MSAETLAALDVSLAVVEAALAPAPRRGDIPRWALPQANADAFELLMSGTDLPHPHVVPLAEAVYVSVADPDDLAVWLEARGGVVRKSPVSGGLQVLTLHTTAGRVLRDFRDVQIRVSVVVPVGGPTNPFIEAAVRP
jgi:hypothetical protein